ncbi:MAG: phosphoribosyl-ATP diphosphatase [Alphaproteobacteria bacterium]
MPQRTTRLVADGLLKMSKKLVEEAGEAALAAATDDRAELVSESADVLYHLTVLWAAHGISPEEVWAEMSDREAAYGVAEKRAKRSRKKVAFEPRK